MVDALRCLAWFIRQVAAPSAAVGDSGNAMSNDAAAVVFAL